MIQKGGQAGDQEGATPGVAGVHSQSEGLLAFLQARRSQVSGRKRKRTMSGGARKPRNTRSSCALKRNANNKTLGQSRAGVSRGGRKAGRKGRGKKEGGGGESSIRTGGSKGFAERSFARPMVGRFA